MATPKKEKDARSNVISILDALAVPSREQGAILESFDAMEAGSSTSVYQTRVAPSPADERVSHLPPRAASAKQPSPLPEPPGVGSSRVWEVGRAYLSFGRDRIVCLRRFFDGPLEMVEVAHEPRCPADATRAESVAFLLGRQGRVPEPCRCSVKPLIRTARTLADTVKPKVANTLGGVTNPSLCNHRWYPAIVADAGPHVGLLCCTACGAPTESR